MEYANGSDLRKFLKNLKKTNNKLQEKTLIEYFTQVTKCLEYIHSQRIVHRDLKPGNIFIVDGVMKLGDFGISKILEKTGDFTQSNVGTPFYFSPEICKGQKYDFKTDLWNLGCILFELATLEKPFTSEGYVDLIDVINNKNPDFNKINYSSKIVQLCRMLLEKNPSKRPTCSQVLNYLSKNNDYYKAKNKLEIEISSNESNEDISPKYSPELSSTKTSPSFLNSISQKLKVISNSFSVDSQNRSQKNKISPFQTPTTLRKNIANTNDSTPTSTTSEFMKEFPSNNLKNYKKNIPMPNTHKTHFRKISYNISSIQSQDLDPTYLVEAVKVETYNKPYKVKSITPTCHSRKQYKHNIKPPKQIPKSTKDTNICSNLRVDLFRQFLIEEYNQTNFDYIVQLLKEKSLEVDSDLAKKVKLRVGDRYLKAIKQIKYLLTLV